MNKNTSNKSRLLMLTTAVIVVVLSIHFGIAVALVNMQMPEPRVEKPKKSKPIEIELVQIEEKKPEPEPEPEVVELKLSDKTSKVVKSHPKPNKRDEKPKNTAATNNKPPITKQPIKNQNQNKNNQTNQDNSPKNEDSNHGEDNPGDNSNQDQNRGTTPEGIDPLITQQTQKVIGSTSKGNSEQQSGTSNVNNNVPTKVQTAGGNKNTGSGGNKKGPPQPPSNSKPQKFTINDAKWKVRPKFTRPKIPNKPRGGSLEVVLIMTVDTQGKVSSRVDKSSGNPRVDQTAITQVNRAKLVPFTTEDGQPVIGEVSLTVEYDFNK